MRDACPENCEWRAMSLIPAVAVVRQIALIATRGLVQEIRAETRFSFIIPVPGPRLYTPYDLRLCRFRRVRLGNIPQSGGKIVYRKVQRDFEHRCYLALWI